MSSTIIGRTVGELGEQLLGDLGEGRHPSVLGFRKVLAERGVPVDRDDMPIFGEVLVVVVTAGNGPDGQHVGLAAVGHNAITGLEVAESEEVPGFHQVAAGTIGPVVVDRVFEFGIAGVLGEIADFVPSDANVVLGQAIRPVPGILARCDLPYHSALRARVEVGVEEPRHFTGRQFAQPGMVLDEHRQMPVGPPRRCVPFRRATQQGNEGAQVWPGVDRQKMLGVIGRQRFRNQGLAGGEHIEVIDVVEGLPFGRVEGCDELAAKAFPCLVHA